jgi:tetratricopeptide (TPR) repeat protein
VTPQQAQWADNSFRRGVTALATRDYISAIACLGEAVRLNPKEGRYHAYFGRALSCDPGARRQAEIEFIAAIRLEPENLSYPIMLAEFYWNMNFPLRAQGELRRVLQKDPFNQEATALRNKIEAALLKK